VYIALGRRIDEINILYCTIGWVAGSLAGETVIRMGFLSASTCV
jgi:hypothetical protein